MWGNEGEKVNHQRHGIRALVGVNLEEKSLIPWMCTCLTRSVGRCARRWRHGREGARGARECVCTYQSVNDGAARFGTWHEVTMRYLG